MTWENVESSFHKGTKFTYLPMEGLPAGGEGGRWGVEIQQFVICGSFLNGRTNKLSKPINC